MNLQSWGRITFLRTSLVNACDACAYISASRTERDTRIAISSASTYTMAATNKKFEELDEKYRDQMPNLSEKEKVGRLEGVRCVLTLSSRYWVFRITPWIASLWMSGSKSGNLFTHTTCLRQRPLIPRMLSRALSKPKMLWETTGGRSSRRSFASATNKSRGSKLSLLSTGKAPSKLNGA